MNRSMIDEVIKEVRSGKDVAISFHFAKAILGIQRELIPKLAAAGIYVTGNTIAVMRLSNDTRIHFVSKLRDEDTRGLTCRIF